MQKISIAIVLALTLSCAIAASYTVTEAGWVKKPVTICNDTESCNNYQNYGLVSLTSSDVNFAAWNASTGTTVNSTSWSVFTKTLVTKDLSSTVNKTLAYNAHQFSAIAYGYAIAIMNNLDAAGISQLHLYQTQLSNLTALPAVQITNNTDKTFTPVALAQKITTKSIFIIFSYADKKVNATSYPIGTATQGKMIVISAGSISTIGIAVGEALSSSQAYITWQEVDTGMKVGIVDFTAGTLTGTADLTGFNKGYACLPYATDKKYYGVICQYIQGPTAPATATNNTIFVSANSTTLYPLFVVADIKVQVVDTEVFAYGPYITVFSKNPSTPAATVLSYDIWDLEKYNTTKANTPFLTYDTTVQTREFVKYRIPQGGLYFLAYNQPAGTILTNTNIQVGQLMGASYLTSVFGSLLAIIAGLFLF